MITTGETSNLFTPGTHGSTFGGNPVSCAAALAVLEVLESENLLERAHFVSGRFRSRLHKGRVGLFRHIRGRGMLLAIELDTTKYQVSAGSFAAKAMENGILVNAVTSSAIRLAPALTISDEELEQALSAWASTCQFFAGETHATH